MVTPRGLLPPSLDEIKSRLAPFCRRHRIARLEVFGSLARGESHDGSDVDLLVTFQPEVHLGWDFFDLHKEIEDVLGCEVDLLTRRSVELEEKRSAGVRSLNPPVKSIPPKQAGYLLDWTRIHTDKTTLLAPACSKSLGGA
jgi:uncharacterized protein